MRSRHYWATQSRLKRPTLNWLARSNIYQKDLGRTISTANSQINGKGSVMGHQVFAFATNDQESIAEIQATEATDAEALGREFDDSGLSVDLCKAELRANEIWVPVSGSADLELVQQYFKPVLRWVSRGDMLAVRAK